VKSDVGPSSLRDNLLAALEGGLGNVLRAQSQASGGDTRRARLALENAERDLSKFVQRLNGSRGRRLIPRGVAGPPAAEARAIRDTIATLASTL
jgi:hypothetical protein